MYVLNFFKNLSACELIALSNALSFLIAQELSIEELNTFITFLSSLTSNLSIFASEKDNFEDLDTNINSDTNTNNLNDIL